MDIDSEGGEILIGPFTNEGCDSTSVETGRQDFMLWDVRANGTKPRKQEVALFGDPTAFLAGRLFSILPRPLPLYLPPPTRFIHSGPTLGARPHLGRRHDSRSLSQCALLGASAFQNTSIYLRGAYFQLVFARDKLSGVSILRGCPPSRRIGAGSRKMNRPSGYFRGIIVPTAFQLSKSCRSSSTSIGLTRWWLKPASTERRLYSSWPHPEIAINFILGSFPRSSRAT